MTTPLFIDSPINVLRGDAARVALAQTNDAAYYTEGKGVLSVPLERWQAAQAYERFTWLNQGLMLTEDRNSEHAAMFDGYKALPQELGDVIELGCGPFTNLVHILQTRIATSVTLLDPLLGWYLDHPHCAYNGQFCGYDAHKWAASIEEYEPDFRFDTVAIINVLSHCQNAQSVFHWINAHIHNDGTLVFHEPARDIDPTQFYDAGHPLSYTQAVIDEFLEGYTPVYKNGDYFIGRKK